MAVRPAFRSIVLDTTDVRGLAEFYRELLSYEYLPGDEPPAVHDWLVLVPPAGSAGVRLAFQEVEMLERTTWPEGPVPQQLHLDFSVGSVDDLRAAHEQALALGATVLDDRFDDPDERLYVYADPAGHPFCIFVPADPGN